MLKYNFSLALFLLLSHNLKAQHTDSLFTPGEIIEREYPDEDKDADELEEFLEELQKNPVRINTNDASRISQLPFLTSSEAGILKLFVSTHAPFFSAAELFMIKNIPEKKIAEILPFITTDTLNPASLNRPGLLSGLRINVRTRFRLDDASYKYSFRNYGNMNRIKFIINEKIEAGFGTEKDKGEKRINDLMTAFIRFKNLPLITSLIIGDFLFESAQGLLFWNPYSVMAGQVNSVIRNPKGLYPDCTNNEENFFRGAAAETEFNNIYLKGFYSSRRKDASYDSSGNILSFDSDGYHRTDSELRRKNSVLENSYGGSISYSKGLMSFGLNFYSSLFNRSYKGQQKFNGISIFSEIHLGNINISAESLVPGSFTAAVNITPDRSFQFSSVYRKKVQGQENLYGSVMGLQGSGEQQGLYTFFTYFSNPLLLQLSFDQYLRRSTDKYNGELSGSRLNLTVEYIFSGKARVSTSYTLKNKEDIIEEEKNFLIEPVIKQNFRIQLLKEYKPVKMKFRVELTDFYIRHTVSEKGFLMMEDISFHFLKILSLQERIIFFRTASFNSAVYEYESGIPGIMENKALYGEGIRFYISLKIAISSLPVFHLKYSRTNKEGEDFSDQVIFQADMNI